MAVGQISAGDTFREALGRLRFFARRYRGRLAAGFMALFAVDILQLAIPRVIKSAVDAIHNRSATPDDLFRFGVIIVLIAVGIGLFRLGWRYLLLGFSRLVERDLREELFKHALTLDKSVLQQRSVGEVMALSSNDLAAVQLACGMGLVAFADAVVISIAAIGFMIYINPLLTVAAVAPLPVLVLLTRLLSSRLHRHFQKVQEQFSRISEFARSSLSSVRLVKAYTQEGMQVSLFHRLGQGYIRENLRLALVQGILFPVAGLVANISLLSILYFGGRFTLAGEISMGDFVAFMSYLAMLTWPMMAFGWVANLFQRGATSMARIGELLRERPALCDNVSEAPAETGRVDRVALSALSFTYPGREIPALADISLQLSSGVCGVVGRTGSGKTTLCHLLARYYPVKNGEIFLNGVDVNQLSLAAVRGGISYVPQDVVLFSDTVAANIAMGKPDATAEEIEAAARTAVIHDEIVAMEQGYQTRIGERGVKLSGGQRQRIALARALILDRPVFILDDALSAVDMETEHAIIRSIAAYLRGKICLIVSHRLASLAEADTILVLDQGRIVARGGHDQLIRENVFYQTIYRHQTTVAAGGV